MWMRLCTVCNNSGSDTNDHLVAWRGTACQGEARQGKFKARGELREPTSLLSTQQTSAVLNVPAGTLRYWRITVSKT